MWSNRRWSSARRSLSSALPGPGESLATDHALQTLERVRGAFPHLLLCLSTNGLLLGERASDLLRIGVKTLTVTVNAVESDILPGICDGISFHGESVGGRDGCEILIENQLEGIRKVAEKGVTVKVNTVLVPGVNDGHIGRIAEAAAEAGAALFNVIPLIPQHKLADARAPDCQELESARSAAGAHLAVFRHCMRCRADACGVPGTGPDLGSLLYAGAADGETTFSHG